MSRPTIEQVACATLVEPYETYHAYRERYLTSHQLIDFARNPLLFRKQRLGLVGERDSEDFRFGRATHTFILEGQERFHQDWIVGGPINPKTNAPYGSETKAYAEWRAAQPKPAISDEQFSLLMGMHAGVRAHRQAAELLASGLVERTLRSHHLGFDIQARFDWVSGVGVELCDLKSCADLDDFEADLWRYAYPWQQAFYLMTAHAAGLTLPLASNLIAIEKKEPFRCGVFRLTAPTLRPCLKELRGALYALREANRDPDLWPTGAEQVRVVRRPKSLPPFGGDFIQCAIDGAKEESWL